MLAKKGSVQSSQCKSMRRGETTDKYSVKLAATAHRPGLGNNFLIHARLWGLHMPPPLPPTILGPMALLLSESSLSRCTGYASGVPDITVLYYYSNALSPCYSLQLKSYKARRALSSHLRPDLIAHSNEGVYLATPKIGGNINFQKPAAIPFSWR